MNWYWQTEVNGTSTASSGSTYLAMSSGTYYIRAKNTATGCWSSGAGSLAVVVLPAPSSTDYFRSKASGNWSSPSTWETSADGSVWCSATSAPTSAATDITILNGHTVTVDVSSTASTLLLSGALNFSGTSTLGITGDFIGAGTFTCGSGTVDFNGAGPQTIPARTYNNLTVSNGSTKTQGGVITVNGDLDVASGTTFTAMAYVLTVTGSTTVDGTFYFGANTGAKTFTGDVTISSTGNWNHADFNQAAYFGGSLSNSGIFSSLDNICHFTGTGKTFSGTIDIRTVDIDGSYTNNGTLYSVTGPYRKRNTDAGCRCNPHHWRAWKQCHNQPPHCNGYRQHG